LRRALPAAGGAAAAKAQACHLEPNSVIAQYASVPLSKTRLPPDCDDCGELCTFPCQRCWPALACASAAVQQMGARRVAGRAGAAEQQPARFTKSEAGNCVHVQRVLVNPDDQRAGLPQQLPRAAAADQVWPGGGAECRSRDRGSCTPASGNWPQRRHLWGQRDSRQHCALFNADDWDDGGRHPELYHLWRKVTEACRNATGIHGYLGPPAIKSALASSQYDKGELHGRRPQEVLCFCFQQGQVRWQHFDSARRIFYVSVLIH
jgi:hypothetical protein